MYTNVKLSDGVGVTFCSPCLRDKEKFVFSICLGDKEKKITPLPHPGAHFPLYYLEL